MTDKMQVGEGMGDNSWVSRDGLGNTVFCQVLYNPEGSIHYTRTCWMDRGSKGMDSQTCCDGPGSFSLDDFPKSCFLL